MLGPVEPLTQQLIHRFADPFGLALLTGVTSSSFWIFGNIGIALDGALPATITESERTKVGVSNASALKLWGFMYDRGKKQFGVASVLSGAMYLTAAVLRPDLRPILFGASFTSFLITPYTFVVLKPINNKITKIANDSSKPDAKGPESGLVDKLLGDWAKYHSVRMSIGAVAWTLGMAALLLAY